MFLDKHGLGTLPRYLFFLQKISLQNKSSKGDNDSRHIENLVGLMSNATSMSTSFQSVKCPLSSTRRK